MASAGGYELNLTIEHRLITTRMREACRFACLLIIPNLLLNYKVVAHTMFFDAARSLITIVNITNMSTQ